MLKVISPKRAYNLAETHSPVAYQGFRHFWDYPVEIKLGGDPRAQFPEAMTEKPVAYFWARTDGAKFYYIGYAIFHAMDWAKLPSSLLPGEVHRYDLEGVLCRVPYYLPHCRPIPPCTIITVFHHELKSWQSRGDYRPCVWIEPGGHGIRSFDPRCDTGVQLKVGDWRLLPFDPIMESPKNRETIREEFNNNKVNLPDQWSDRGRYPGWFWSRPDELFAALSP